MISNRDVPDTLVSVISMCTDQEMLIAVNFRQTVYVVRVTQNVSLFAVVTMMLALSVYQVTINDKLPTTSDAVPLLGKSHHWFVQ